VKRVLIALGVALVLSAVGTWLYFRGEKYIVVITQKEIDTELRAKFPVTKAALILFSATYSNPKVTLLPGTNRIRIGIDTELDIKLPSQTKKLNGKITVTTSFSYDNETKQFFLADPVISKLEIQGIPPEYTDKVTGFLSENLSEYLQKFPIYRLKANDAKGAAIKLLLKDVQVTNQEVNITLGL